jgi:hypothetical protein
MKFIVAGQKKESWFYNKKNRIIYAVIASLISPFVLATGESFEWKSIIWTMILFAGFELIIHKTNKEEKADGMITLEFLDDIISIKFFSGDVVEIPHNQIQAIHKDVTKIVIDVKNKDFVYTIPYSFFSYNDLQKIKKEVDRISKKISTQPKENPAFN